MAVRTVEFKVSESGILPSSQQFGGVQGEHCATCVSFTLEEDLFNKISASSGGSRVVYRFDAYDGAGGFKRTEPIELGNVNEPLEFYLQEWQTRFGGNVSVFLVITEIKGDSTKNENDSTKNENDSTKNENDSTKNENDSTKNEDYSTEMELYSFPAVLRLKSRPEGEAVDGGNYESVSTLAESAKNSAKLAQLSATAAAMSLDELLASVPKVKVLEVTDGVEIKVTEKDEVSVAKVYNGKDGADGKDGKDADLSLIANALKGSASGQGYVVVKDVSPLEHEVKVQLSNSSGGGEESVSQTATLNGTMRELLLDEPSSKVHVKFEQVDTYCDGAIVPLVDGEDLKAVADVIVSPAYLYGEQPALLDITYTITDSTLEWKGTYTSLTSTETEPEEISGSYTLSSSGQKIIGFYQIYEEPEDNPDYSDGSGGNMENTLDIIVSVLANSFSGVTVAVGGKNLFDVTKNCASNNASTTVSFNNDVITVDFVTLKGAVGTNWGKKVKYSAGTYTATFIPITENASANFVIYGSDKTTELFNKAVDGYVGKVAKGYLGIERYSITFTTTEDFYFCVCGVPIDYRGIFDFKIQIERGTSATEFEPYVEPVTYTANADGSVDGVKSVYPSTSVSVEDASTAVNIEYNRDINKAFAELQAAVISLGGNV